MKVLGPDGVSWTVRRRWSPWRRALGLREVWYSSTASSDDTTTSPDQGEQSRPGVLLAGIGIVLWLIIGLGKVVVIVIVAGLVVVASTIDLILQLVVLPFVLLARIAGLTRWPVQIDRQNLHFRTESAEGFAAAAALRDRLAAQIADGSTIDDLAGADAPPLD